MKTIGVISIKGGVGKTSTVVSLGASMASLGKKVLLVDGNLSAPNLGMHLGIDKKRGVHDVLSGKVRPETAIYASEIFDVMPASMFKPKAKNPLSLKSKLKGLKKYYDIILIDSSPALDNETLAAMNASNELIVVTTPDLPTLNTTMLAVKLAKQKKTPIKGLILNKVHKKDFEVSLSDMEQETGVPVLAVLPYDVNVLEALAQKKPFPEYKKKAEGAVEYRKLASALLGKQYTGNKFGSWLKRLFGVKPKDHELNRISTYYESLFE